MTATNNDQSQESCLFIRTLQWEIMGGGFQYSPIEDDIGNLLNVVLFIEDTKG